MSFFYDLNKRLANLAKKTEQEQIAESKKAEAVAQSPLTKALNETKRLPDLPFPKTQKDVEKHYGGSKIKMAQDLHDQGFTRERIAQKMQDLKHGTVKKEEELDERSTGDYSAKKARAGKDIGKPGKMFSKIGKSAGERYGSKERGEKVAGAVLAKLRKGAKESVQEASGSANIEKVLDAVAKIYQTQYDGGDEIWEADWMQDWAHTLMQANPTDKELDFIIANGHMPKRLADVEFDVGDDFQFGESALQAYLGKKKYGEQGMKALQKAGREHAGKEKMAKIRAKYDKMDEADMEEGNAFTGALAKTPKGGKFKVGGKEFTDTSNLEEADNPGLEEGFKEMDAWLAQREKEKGTGKFDKKKISTGTVYTRKAEEEPEDDDDTPKKVGRKIVGAGKGKKLGAKHSGRSKLASKSAIAEEIPMMDRGEYDDEAGMAKDSLHTIVRSARELENALRSNENLPEWVQEKIGQIKGMMSSVTDYMLSAHERAAEEETGHEGITIGEKAVSVAQRRAAGIAHAAQKGEIPKSQLRGASKEMAKMDKSELHKFAATKEKDLPKKVKEAGKPDFLDLDKDGDKKEPMKKAAKEKTVDETTTAGSVATAPAAVKSSKGMQFGKGVYESLDSKLESMISEGMSVTVNMAAGEEGEPRKSINVVADGEDADKLAELLKMAGLGHKQEACSACGHSPCDCEEELDENSPDWPTEKETLAAEPNLRTYSGGLNGPKSTGQTTVPVIASQLRRQASMEEGVKLERTLSTLYKNYKAK